MLPALLLPAPTLPAPATTATSIGLELVRVPAGAFTMGRPWSEQTATLGHEVTLTRAFEMSTTEVTQAQFEQVTGANPVATATTTAGQPCARGDLNESLVHPGWPVVCVSWDEAVAFANALSPPRG